MRGFGGHFLRVRFHDALGILVLGVSQKVKEMAWVRIKTVVHTQIGKFEGNYKVVENPKRQLEEDLAMGHVYARRDCHLRNENGLVYIPPAMHDYSIVEIVFEEIEPPILKGEVPALPKVVN